MTMRGLLAGAWFVIVAIVGCDRPAVAPPPKAGYHFEVHGAEGATTGQSLNFQIRRNETEAVMQGGMLTVNGKKFGSIPDGAKIVVKENGQVWVNETELQPK
jgi:hypothetical protein